MGLMVKVVKFLTKGHVARRAPEPARRACGYKESQFFNSCRST
jgi:hypothetical protein